MIKSGGIKTQATRNLKNLEAKLYFNKKRKSLLVALILWHFNKWCNIPIANNDL